MKFGNSYMAVSITVVPNNDMDFLLGLDNLKRLRGVIDLNRNVLCLDGAVDREEVAFLGWVKCRVFVCKDYMYLLYVIVTSNSLTCLCLFCYYRESDLPEHAKGNYTEPAEDNKDDDNDTNSKPSHMDTSR